LVLFILVIRIKGKELVINLSSLRNAKIILKTGLQNRLLVPNAQRLTFHLLYIPDYNIFTYFSVVPSSLISIYTWFFLGFAISFIEISIVLISFLWEFGIRISLVKIPY
jgi:hypothetical protein